MPKDTFMGYLRLDGSVGVRNRVAIIPSCGCANHAAKLIANKVPGAMLLDYTGGCGETGLDITLATRLLSQYGRHPNVIGSVVVSLGCESLNAAELAASAGAGWAGAELVGIQQSGSTRAAVEKGVAIAQRMLADVDKWQRTPQPVSALTIGLECGGSDATSGMAANPAMGHFSDLLAARGAKVILAETSEMLGAEHILAERAITPEIAAAMLRTVEACEAALKATGEDFMGKQPSPGNIKGGISTVEEKALGDVLKGGTSPLVDVLAYGQPPTKAGLSFMDTPGNDPCSVTGLVAAGAQIVVFTTGRGNPMGNAIAPVIKVTGNPETYQRMSEDMDVNAGTIILGQETIAQVGQRIYDLCLRVAGGEQVSAEVLEHAEFMMLRVGPVY
ncbi:MAG: UxaA family hydrolase [Chloroflexi bacterium]|nr:UxaA family hydrolase [Chloroflexota bacterium]